MESFRETAKGLRGRKQGDLKKRVHRVRREKKKGTLVSTLLNESILSKADSRNGRRELEAVGCNLGERSWGTGRNCSCIEQRETLCPVYPGGRGRNIYNTAEGQMVLYKKALIGAILMISWTH